MFFSIEGGEWIKSINVCVVFWYICSCGRSFSAASSEMSLSLQFISFYIERQENNFFKNEGFKILWHKIVWNRACYWTVRPCIFNLVFLENVMIQKYEENVNTKNMNSFKFLITDVEQRQWLRRLYLKSKWSIKLASFHTVQVPVFLHLSLSLYCGCTLL